MSGISRLSWSLICIIVVNDKRLREYVLDNFVDKVYVYKGEIVITFHFTDEKLKLSYKDTFEMIENHRYLMDCVNESEAHVVDSPLVAKMKESILSGGDIDPDFLLVRCSTTDNSFPLIHITQ